MQSWSQGYVADIPYTGGFYHHQSPAALWLAAVMGGYEAFPRGHSFTYCELACGQGVTAALLAAANPNGKFTAVDFNPAHIATARDFADRHGIGNVDFLECGFEDLIETHGANLPQFDMITLHGVYTWVAPSVQHSIIEFLRRYLKPGGLVGISYNSLPGWSSIAPLQRLLYEFAEEHPGRSNVRLAEALKTIGALREAGAQHLGDDAHFNAISAMTGRGATSYLVHEYINAHWQPMFHLDVARDLAKAKLDYVGSAQVLDNFPALSMTEQQRELWSKVSRGDLQETLRDFFVPRMLRKDVFVRGARRLSARRQEELLRGLTVAAVVPRSEIALSIPAAVGMVQLEAEVYGPMLDALSKGPQTIGALMDLDIVRHRSRASAVEVAGLLVGTGKVMPAQPGLPMATPAATSINAEAIAQAIHCPMAAQHAVALTGLGSGLHLSTLDCIVADARQRGLGGDEIVDAVWHKAEASGESMMEGNHPIIDSTALRARIAKEVALAQTKLDGLKRCGFS